MQQNDAKVVAEETLGRLQVVTNTAGDGTLVVPSLFEGSRGAEEG